MKKALILGFVFVLGSGYFVYQRWLSAPSPDAWDFIPSHAALVWESESALQTVDSTQTLGVWSAISELSAIHQLNDHLKSLDTAASTDSFLQLFSDAPALVAVFPISSEQLDALVVIKVGKGKMRNHLSEVAKSFEKRGYEKKGREYSGMTIEEVANPSKDQLLSYFLIGDYFVGSFTSFLVEDAVRTINNPSQSFRQAHPQLTQLTPLRQDEGNVFVNVEAFAKLLKLFTGEDIAVPGGSTFLDVDVRASSVKLAGFTFPAKDILSTFSSGPTSFEMLEVVPNSTAVLKHFSFESTSDWRARMINYDPKIKEAVDGLKAAYDVDTEYLFGLIRREMAVADLEVVGNEQPDKLLLFEVSDTEEAAKWLRLTAARMSSDSLFSDREGDYEIVRLDDPAIGQALLGQAGVLSTECYYLFHRNYVFLSNSLGELKRTVQAIYQDNTWKKSLRVNSMLELANKEANYSVMVNMPRAWNRFMQVVKPKWKGILMANERGFKSLEFVGAQYSKVDNKFYTSLIAYQPEIPRQPAKLAQAETSSLPAKIITKPFVVRTHANPTLEVIVQDSTLQVYHLSNELDIVWATRVSSQIVGAVVPVDYYLNGKIQYAFITEGHLHIIDRTGTYVEGFPVKVPTKAKLKYFSVVDYDGSRNYRFMCTDTDGDIWLLDKTGKPLNGWAPRVAGRNLLSAPRHIRVAGKDAFILHKKREIDVVNRSGVSYPGFPMDMQTDLLPSFFTKATGSFETSTLTSLSTLGEIIRINFGGRVESREQLVRANEETTFEMVPDVLENTFLIVRRGAGNWEVLDATGVKLFEKAYVGESTMVQFYRFGGDKALLLLTDTDKGFLTVLDLMGQPITQRPLPVAHAASVIYFENQDVYQFYLSRGKVVEKVRLD